MQVIKPPFALRTVGLRTQRQLGDQSWFSTYIFTGVNLIASTNYDSVSNIGLFLPVSCRSLPQNESSTSKTFIWNEFSLHVLSCKSNSFSYEGFYTRTRFEIEAQDNSWRSGSSTSFFQSHCVTGSPSPCITVSVYVNITICRGHIFSEGWKQKKTKFIPSSHRVFYFALHRKTDCLHKQQWKSGKWRH